MKKTKNIDFEEILQKEEFIRLLNEDPIHAYKVIEDLCRENPDKEESIRLAVSLVKLYQAEQSDVDGEKITMIWDNILRNSEARKSARIFRFTPVWRIVASVAILMSLTFCLFEYSRNHSIRSFAEEKFEISDEARIIISDGSEYLLKSNDSHIRYDADGKEIIIEEKNDMTEKVNNQPTETKALYNQIVVPFGKRHGVTLSDGTIVQLNSGSKLVFPAKFSDSKREVFLVGEGYFEVAKDAGKPFIVNTNFINVKVLGTHFNISAYKNDKLASAVLIEGSVEVYNTNFFKNDRCKIEPGQGCFFSENSSGLKIQNVNVDEYVSWKDGFFQLIDQPLESIAKKVEKYYNKKIVIDNNELSHRIISGKLVLSDRFEETIDFLARTTNSRYIINEDGTYVFVK